MLRCMIVDDEPHSVELMESYVQKTPFLQLVFSGTNPLEAIAYLHAHPVDLVLLDVQMPELTGLDFIKTMPGKSKVILCTSYAEYALEGYEHNIADYLLKPINYARFLKAASKAAEMMPAPLAEQPFLFIKSEVKGKMIRIDHQEICFIESIRNYVAFHKEKEKVVAILRMRDLEAELPAQEFIRVHKSYIVAKSRIAMIEGNVLRLKNRNDEIPIGGIYKEKLLQALNIKG
jgi:two-component system, LytTR family, response regulator